MQTEASTLPVVRLNVHKTFTRISKPDSRRSTLESKKVSPCRNTLPPSNKKCLNPLLGEPYRNNIKQQSPSDESKFGNKSILKQRITSAEMLRFKQLQNQLADAHYHLNELANENRLLKALQKKQDSALRRYEGTNAELPRIINSHHEELRVLQAKYKKLKGLHKDTCNLLKEKETELHSVNSQNKHLLQLSKDRNLGEREKLQLQITDMNDKIQQQQETIGLLHRKLALETKSLKHQLRIEISKHKDTQKNLQKTIEKLKSLECLLDNREKRLYYSGQLPIYNKEKTLGSHSLTNLSVSNSVKTSSRNIKYDNNILRDSLPLLDILESSNDEKVTRTTNDIKLDHSMDQLKSETMANLQQIRKFRLQRSPYVHKNAHSMDDLRFDFKDSESRTRNNKETTLYQNALIDFKAMPEKNGLNNDRNASGKLKKLFNRTRNQNLQKLQKGLKVEFDYLSDDIESGTASEHHIDHSTDTTQKSRELYARLISTDDTSDTLNHMLKRVNIHCNNDDNDDDDDEENDANVDEEEEEEEKEELNKCLARSLAFQEYKYRSKSEILPHKDNNLSDSGSEVNSVGNIDTNVDYCLTDHKINSFQSNFSNYNEERFNQSSDSATKSEYNTLEMRKQYVSDESKTANLQRISNNALANINMGNIENLQQSSDIEKVYLEEQYSLKSNRINKPLTSMEKEAYMKKGKTECLGDKTIYTDISYDKTYHETSKKKNTFNESKTLPNSEKKEVEKDLQQAHEIGEHEIVSIAKFVKSEETEYVINANPQVISNKKSIEDHFDKDSHTMYNLVKCNKFTVEEMPDVIHANNEEILNKNGLKHCAKAKNELNISLEVEDINTSSNNVYMPHKTEQNDGKKDEMTDIKKVNNKKKGISYNKEKLLATMKAIDNNENIEFLNQGFRNHNTINRMQITENLFRGLPTHSKPKRDVIKDIFEDNHVENKDRGTCSKSH